MKLEPTDQRYEPQTTDCPPWQQPVCRHCGQPMYMHWKMETGEVRCTREVASENGKAEP